MDKKKISVIIPSYNEENNIMPMYKRLIAVFRKSSYEYEIIFVNNGSTDRSDSIFENLAKKDIRVKVIFLSRNFYKPKGANLPGFIFFRVLGLVPLVGVWQAPQKKIPDLIKQWEK